MKAQLKFRFTVLRFRLIGIWFRISRFRVLKVDLDDPDDKINHLRCTKSLDMALALWDFDQWLRGQIKYQNKDYEEARDELYRTMDEYSIDLDELIS